MEKLTEKELTAKFDLDQIYYIDVPHREKATMVCFFGEKELIENTSEWYSRKYDDDWDIETPADALDCLRHDSNTGYLIYNLLDCFWVWKSAIRSHIINIINDDTDIYLEDYEDAEKFMAAIEPTCKEIL